MVLHEVPERDMAQYQPDFAEYTSQPLVANSRFRCHRAVFTPAEFEHHERWYWRIPQPWGHPSSDFLHRAWDEGGVGAVSVLPILGQHALTDIGRAYNLSSEELARLAGIDPKTVRKAAKWLSREGLATTRMVKYRDVRLMQWTVSPSLAHPHESSGKSECFSFSMRVVYGGAWTMLTAAQRLVYITLATQARTYREPLERVKPLTRRLPRATSQDDLAAAYGAHGYIRLAIATHAKISALSGLAPSVVAKAVSAFRAVSPGSADWDTDAGKYGPLTAYRAAGNDPNIYHFRDHAPPWPCELLNAPSPRSLQSQVTAEEDDNCLELVA